MYLNDEMLSLEIIRRGSIWFDAGTPDSLLRASLFVDTFEKQSGVMLGCIEEAAYNKGLINKKQLLKLANPLMKSGYGLYLQNLIK